MKLGDRMEQIQHDKPELYKGQSGQKPTDRKNAYVAPRAKEHWKLVGQQEAKNPLTTDEELLQFMEKLGLVELGMEPLLYRGKAPQQSRFAPQNLYGLRPQQGSKVSQPYGGLDKLLSGTPKGSYQHKQGGYTGLNVQYLGSDGTMYQFSALGPVQNKQQMVGQVLMGLYAAMMSEGHDSKKGPGAQQSYGKA